MVSIFNSSITLKELEETLQRHFGTESKFGPNVAFRDLGEGNGIASQVGLLTADWQPASDSLPTTFAVKVATSAEKHTDNELEKLSRATKVDEEKMERLVNYHNTECLILSRLKDYEEHIMLAEVYAYKERKDYKDDGYIIMKHYDGVASYLHMNNNLPEGAIEAVISQLARIHKSGKLFTAEEQEKMKGKMFQITFNVLFEPGMMKSLSEMIKDFGGEMMAVEAAEIPTVLEEMSQPEYLKFIDETCENMGIPRLLCHGDVWMCNMLWKRTGDHASNEQYDLQALIDLQTAQFSCAAADLVRLFTGCMSGKDRRENWEKNIKTWYNFIRCGPEPSPYTYEQMVEAYRRVFPACAFIVAGSIGAVGPAIIKKQKDEDAQREAHKNLLEKQHALLQDIIKYHKRNMSLIRSLPN